MAPAQSARFLATAGRVIRDCFKGPTILAAAILIVMFMTAYVPFVGAWLGRTVAVLMTLGAGGTTEAVIMLGAVLVVTSGCRASRSRSRSMPPCACPRSGRFSSPCSAG